MNHKLIVVFALLVAALTLTGCATKKYVNAEVAASDRVITK